MFLFGPKNSSSVVDRPIRKRVCRKGLGDERSLPRHPEEQSAAKSQGPNADEAVVLFIQDSVAQGHETGSQSLTADRRTRFMTDPQSRVRTKE